MLNIAAMFFSRAVWSRLKTGLFGPPSPIPFVKTVQYSRIDTVEDNRRDFFVSVILAVDEKKDWDKKFILLSLQ